MSQYPEIMCSIIKEIDGVRYYVRQYGLNKQVFEEELVPIPKEKIIRTMNVDGAEDIAKQETILIKWETVT